MLKITIGKKIIIHFYRTISETSETSITYNTVYYIVLFIFIFDHPLRVLQEEPEEPDSGSLGSSGSSFIGPIQQLQYSNGMAATANAVKTITINETSISDGRLKYMWANIPSAVILVKLYNTFYRLTNFPFQIHSN